MVIVRLAVTVPFYAILESLSAVPIRFKGSKITWRGIAQMTIIGSLGFGGSATLMFEGTRLTSAHLGALVTAAGPLFVLAFAKLFLGSPMSPGVLLLIGLAAVGLLWADRIWTLGTALESGWGLLFLLGAATCWGMYSALSQKLLKSYPSWSVMKYGATGGLLVAVGVWAATGAHIEVGRQSLSLGTTLLLLTYVSVVATGLAYYTWNYSVKALGPQIPSLFYFLQPVVAAILSTWVLHEHISWDFVEGAALVIASALTGWWVHRRAEQMGRHSEPTVRREGTDL